MTSAIDHISLSVLSILPNHPPRVLLRVLKSNTLDSFHQLCRLRIRIESIEQSQSNSML